MGAALLDRRPPHYWTGVHTCAFHGFWTRCDTWMEYATQIPSSIKAFSTSILGLIQHPTTPATGSCRHPSRRSADDTGLRPREARGSPDSSSGLLTKMDQGLILRVRDLLAAPAAPGAPLSPTLSFPRCGAYRKIAPATVSTTNTYKKAPEPMASRASVDFSLVDSRAKEVWLPGRGAQRDCKERYRTKLSGKGPSSPPRSWSRQGPTGRRRGCREPLRKC